MILLVDCGRLYPMEPTRCAACQRVIRCVYRTPEEGFLLGRACYRRMLAALAAA
jgi:hypothetical protein